MQKIFEWFQERKLSFKFKRDLKSHWNSCFDLNGAVCHWHWLSNSNDFISSLSDIFTINTWKRQMCPFQICKKGKTYFLFSKMVSLLPFFHFCNSSRCLNWKQIGIASLVAVQLDTWQKNWLVKRYSDWPEKLEPENIFVAIITFPTFFVASTGKLENANISVACYNFRRTRHIFLDLSHILPKCSLFWKHQLDICSMFWLNGIRI